MRTLLFTLFFSFILIVLTFRNTQDNNIGCESNIDIVSYQNQAIAHLNIIFTIDNKKGWASIKGVVEKEEKEFKIDRKIYFNVNKIKDSYNLESTQIINNDKNTDDQINSLLPVIYSKEKTKRPMYIFKQSDGGYLFSNSNIYTFYCR
ncbi:hypothetical protein ACJ9E6_004063 [Providencia rettgeri]